MEMRVIGIRVLDFESDGERVRGTQAFLSFPEDGVIGERVDKLFFKDGFDLPALTPGMTLDVTFNHRGRPERVKEVTPQPTQQRLTVNKQ